VRIHSQHSFLSECEERVRRMPESGSRSRRAAGNRVLELELIDGSSLLICASEFECLARST
jgi:hypothetical protein